MKGALASPSCLGFPGARRGAFGGDEQSAVDPVALHAVTALGDEDVARPRRARAAPSSVHRGPRRALAGGVLRFYEQRYAESVELLEKSAASARAPASSASPAASAT